MVKELPLSLGDGDMRKLSVHTELTNEDLTRVKQKSRILEVLCARIVIDQGLTGTNINMGPNQYRFTRNFLNGQVLCIFDLKLTELRHETVSNLILAMYHVATYFGPKECLSKQKRYIRYKMEKNSKAHYKTVCGIGSRS